MLRPSSVLCLTTLAACFAPDSGAEPARATPVSISLHDPQGARYASEAAPRDLTVKLAFAAPPPPSPAVSLWHGDLHVALAAELGARSEARREAHTVPLVVTTQPGGLALVAATALLPGRRYTLVGGSARAGGDAPWAFSFRVSASAALGAAAVDTLPADGARGVPPNLARALVRFDGELADDDTTVAAHLTWSGPGGAAVPSAIGRTACDALGLPAGTCVFRTPQEPLAPGAYQLETLPGLTTLTGAAVAPVRVRFTVDGAHDAQPPALAPERCADDELAVRGACVLLGDRRVSVRGRLSEPGTVALVPGACAAATRDLAFALDDCPRDADAQPSLWLGDLAGHSTLVPLSLPPSPRLAAVSIDEVRADPRGREPAQEYVELLSSASHPVSLMGFSLSTDRSPDRARTVVGSPSLRPGERALAVGPDFDPADDRDGPLPPGVALVRLDGALGLANQSARVVLRDAAARRLSAASALAPLVEGQCSARRSEDPRAGGLAHFALDPDGACTPGRATFERP